MHGVSVGLVKGLATTARALMRPSHTAEYPDVAPTLPPRSRGVIALVQENCTVCMLCSRECPDWCIFIDSHKETLPAASPGGRERQRNVLDRFAIDYSLCMYCGICVEACPFDALLWSPEFEYSEFELTDLLHEKERLSQWVASVPAPPEPDPLVPEAKEIQTARAAAEKVARAAAGGGEPAGPAARAGRGERPARAERPERPARAERPARPGRPAAENAESPPSESPPPEPGSGPEQGTPEREAGE